MEELNRDQISQYIGNDIIYKIGKENYNNGLIQLEFVGKYLVKSKVNEQTKNRVMVEFKNDGLIKKSLCSCLEYEFTSPCRHVVATCLELIDYIKDHPNRIITNSTLLQEFQFTKSNELRDILKEIYIDNPSIFLSKYYSFGTKIFI
ncbi:hypothetical protein DICPUDRAFT_93327 [Dictyostelium purpureum]|uniref:SWIM-type domain-containing protein n=1 Tax=Dictyostelium purpureum TaxID=5786 RepID=F1A5S6_DICPU|nr:uncharacterized protein DICPUDRAFT_93327 [Dictyostelium purpureum]EGC28457.1 hypothetical protein DICPUDRAFT_93327 [Dictyostelium purpureum]|eukprot:XP_003295020.1 hypothetical protein DICPUDRAFT_93327 [Dictyostelium purpureum]